MKKGLITLLAVLGIVGFMGLSMVSWFFGSYNGAIQLRNTAKTQQSQIEVQMQRRSDLVPNLVASTKGAMKQEQAVFDDIAKAHAAFTNAPSGTVDKMAAGDALSTAIRGYMVVAQQYPNLKSLDIVVSLNDEMSGTENRISVARQRYNESVQGYNTRIQSLPLSLFASSMGFTPMTQYLASEKAQQAPVVNFE
jgi:LemA protein